jgi:hypothetical protein
MLPSQPLLIEDTKLVTPEVPSKKLEPDFEVKKFENARKFNEQIRYYYKHLDLLRLYLIKEVDKTFENTLRKFEYFMKKITFE